MPVDAECRVLSVEASFLDQFSVFRVDLIYSDMRIPARSCEGGKRIYVGTPSDAGDGICRLLLRVQESDIEMDCIFFLDGYWIPWGV